MAFMVPIARSDVHIHMCRKDLDRLFGKGYQLTNIHNLTIPGQYACSECVTLTGPGGSINNVVIVGPVRSYTQVEVSITDSIRLGIETPIRQSGDLEKSPGVTVTGPEGSIVLERGLITAARHIHMHTSDADAMKLKTGDIVSVRIPGPRALVFNEVVIKAGDDQALEMHVDFDEGHAAGIEDFQKVEIII